MKKKCGIICTICIIAGIGLVNIPQKPKLISSITTMDTAYLTILVDKRDSKNVEKLKEKLLKMCIEDSFEEMKLQTKERPLAENLWITVYISKRDLEAGNPFVTIKNDEGS